MSLRIVRIVHPEIGHYEEAARVAAEQWTVAKEIDRQERFLGFQQMGVELVLGYESEELKGVAFFLPDKYETADRKEHFVWLFRIYARPEAKNLGALMLIRIMNWYPAILGIGVTPEAAKLYQTLRWQKYEHIWRCVHPISLTGMVARYNDRLGGTWKKIFLKFVSRGYDFLSYLAALAINPGLSFDKFDPLPVGHLEIKPGNLSIENKLKIISTYLTSYKITSNNRVLETYGITGKGYIVRDDFQGLEKFLAHFKLWRELKKYHITFCEFLATSEKAKRQMLINGYIPIRMPIYYWDKKNKIDGYFINLPKSKFNYGSCDKLL